MADADGIVRGQQVSLPPFTERFGQVVFKTIRSRGDAVAQIYPRLGLTLTYAEEARRAVCVSLELEARGLKPGDVVALVAFAPPIFLPLITGCALRSVALATVNPGLDEGDARTFIRDTLKSSLVVAEEPAAGTIRSACPELTVIDLNEADRWFARSVSEADFERAAPPDPPGWMEMPVLILCSSGTTGPPKGVVHTSRSLLPFLHGLGALSGLPGGAQFDLIVLQTSGVFWISGTSLQLAPVMAGGRVIVVPGFEHEEFISIVEQHKVNLVFMAPNQAVSLAKSGVATADRMSSAKFIMVGGMALDAATQDWAESKLGFKLRQFYATTETLTVFMSGPAVPVPSGSVGKLVNNVKTKVVDPDSGKLLGANQDGELLYESPTLMEGYLRNPEETAKVLDKEGWYHSGDIGHYDSNGFFYITDRIKHLIKYRGHHVNGSELEGRLLTHPAVKDVAVIGVAHETDQEHPTAYVVLQPGKEVTEQELIELVNDKIADHKRLRGGIKFLDKIPKTATGKVKIRQLKGIKLP